MENKRKLTKLLTGLFCVMLVFALSPLAVFGADDDHEHNWVCQVSWNEDNSEATATMVCYDCDAVNEEVAPETVKTTSEVTKKPTCEEWGETTYKATFENYDTGGEETFTQEDIEPLGHQWEYEISWDENNRAELTATCQRCGETVTEKPEVTSEVVQEPTCEEWGMTRYTAHPENPIFTEEPNGFTEEELTETLEDIEPLDHDWGEWIVTKEAAEDVAGEETRTCARCGAQETQDIPPMVIAPTPDDSPKTGDESQTGMMVALMLASAAVMAGAARRKLQ